MDKEEYRRLRRLYYAANYKSQTRPIRHKPTTCLSCGTEFPDGKSWHHSGRCKSCKKNKDRYYWEQNKDEINAKRRAKYLEKGKYAKADNNTDCIRKPNV